MNGNALIGFSGFVGSTLLKQADFEYLYRSKNIEEIRHKEFDTVVCAGAPAQKWLANKSPIEDERIIDSLIGHLSTIKCKKIILISTVDVFKNPVGVDEKSTVDEADLHPYGLNRRKLEKFVENNFSNYLIVRLPGLVGPGLKKNVIFDFHNINNLDLIESRALFQFYPMVNLWSDIKLAQESEIKLLHLTSEPVSVRDVASNCFGLEFNNEILKCPPNYNFKTCYSESCSGAAGYQYSFNEVFLAIRAYVQSEPKQVG